MYKMQYWRTDEQVSSVINEVLKLRVFAWERRGNDIQAGDRLR